MSELTSGVSELDVRLAEIDRRLRTIQTELVPGSQPQPLSERAPAPPELQAVPPLSEPPVPAPPRSASPGRSGPLAAWLLASRPKSERAAADPARDLSELTELHERLLASMRDLLVAYESVLTRLTVATPGATVREFAVSAGPFESTEALRAFEHTLSGLPGVRDVTVRGYEGDDRAIVDVRLSEPTA